MIIGEPKKRQLKQEDEKKQKQRKNTERDQKKTRKCRRVGESPRNTEPINVLFTLLTCSGLPRK